MDQIDINARKAASEMQKNAVSGKAKSEKVVKSPAINIHATASYIKALQTSQDNLPESLNKGLNTLKNNLSIYLNAPDKIEDVPVDSTRESMSTFNKLSLQVISRDSALQEKVAQNLSTSKRLVRARDAQKSLEQSLNSMPQALKEGTGVGRSLSKFVCECLVNLTDPQTIGAGLERDLAMRQIFIPQDRLNSRSASAVSKSLEQSIAFIESNQKDVIARLPKNEYVQEKPGATTPQTMTRYLRKALDEFPDDSTYLDIFKQNRDRTDNAPYDDKVSEEISSRIHSLIAKAAQTARRGNLIPNSRKNAESTPVPTEQVRAQERTFNRPIQSDAPIDENVSARELSLSELSARAARLQKQFRQERMRLVQEGKLPNPATPPESFTVNTTAKEVLSKTLSEPGPAEKLQTARDLALQRAIVDTSAKAPNVADDMATDIKNTVSAQKPAVTADEAHVSTPSEQAKAVAEKTLMQQGTMLDKGVKISYTAAQNNLYGAINMAPGETIAIQTPSLETPAVKGPVEPQSTVEPTKQEPLSPKSLVDEITAQLKKQLADDIVKTIEMKTSNLSEKLDDIKATAEELKNKAQNQESKLTSLEKGLIENSAAIDEAKKQAEEISKEQAKALHDIQSKALEAKQNASVSLQSTADYGRYNFTTSQNTSSILEQKLYSGVNTASTPVHNEEALEPEQNVNTTKPAPQPTDEIYEDQTQEVKPQNKVPVQTTDDTVETDAEEIKPQNKVPVQTADEPADIEAEEVKPQNKVPVQATDDTVETDAEEIKPQNQAPVQTSEEPAEVEAEEVKPQNKAPVQTTEEPAEVEAEEVKPQNKAPVQTTEEPVEVETEEVKPQNKAPVQTTEEPVEVETEEVKPQISTPIQNADELDADDLNGKFAINNDFVDRDIDYDNISTAMPNAQALNSTLITDLENAQGADADNISKLYQYVKPEATDLDLFESQPNKGQSGTAQSTDDGSESVNKPSDIISKVLSQTVPSDDFNDEHNVTLQAIKSEKDIIADITAKSPSIENAEIDDKLNISGRKEAVLNNLVTPPGASVVTTGNSNPIPEQTHIDSMQPVKEGGFFKRIMARFKSGRADEIKDNTAEIKTDNSISTPTVTGKDGQYVLKANPLDQMMYTLRLQSGNPNLPPEFKEEAQKLLNALNNPVDDLISVKNWLNFVTGPISPNSSQALAMHQWAFYILCLRYQQLGKDVHKFLKKSMSSQDIASLMQSLPAIKKDKVLEGPSISMLEETFGQIERLQQQNSNNNNINPLLNRYIPLPPNYDGGREGGFTLKKEKDEDGENTWHLNFAFDLKDLGPIEIKAVAKLPEIKLSFVTENLHAMQKVQELMPDLNYNLQCIGITARTSSMRLGRVSLKESTIAKNPQAPRNDGSTVSVDI